MIQRSLWTGSSSSSLPHWQCQCHHSGQRSWHRSIILNCLHTSIILSINAGCLCFSEWQSCELDVKTMCDLREGFWTNFVDIWGNFPPDVHLDCQLPHFHLDKLFFWKQSKIVIRWNVKTMQFSLSGFHKRDKVRVSGTDWQDCYLRRSHIIPVKKRANVNQTNVTYRQVSDKKLNFTVCRDNVGLTEGQREMSGWGSDLWDRGEVGLTILLP